jgi:hypothetical protein
VCGETLGGGGRDRAPHTLSAAISPQVARTKIVLVSEVVR